MITRYHNQLSLFWHRSLDQKQNTIHKIYRKETDRQNILHINSEHPISLKNSIQYSQVLSVKCTWSTTENFKIYCSELKQKFIEIGYKSDLLDKHISPVKNVDRNEILKEKVKEKPKQTCIPLTLTYNHFCPNISRVIQKHRNLIEVNESLKEIFNCQPIKAFRQNKNLKELIASNKTEKNKVKKRQIHKLKPGKCSSCLTNLKSLCCNCEKQQLLKINKPKEYI